MEEKLDEKQIKSMCLCPGCPSFVDCNKFAFCISEKSKCIKKEKGCLCYGCPVENKMKFKHGYYCTRGNEKFQTKK